MDLCWSVVVALPVAVVILWLMDRGNSSQQQDLLEKINQKRLELTRIVQQSFMIEPCFRCHEFTMTVLEFSPNGRSVHYQCLHCKKKMRAAAATPDAPRAVAVSDELCRLVNQYNGRVGRFQQGKRSSAIDIGLVFDAPAAPLPYEQTTRTPIPEAIRSEVWRRDGGHCLQCGSKQNLQFDHIIPVSQGGATTVVNLQLLCQACNGSKGKKI